MKIRYLKMKRWLLTSFAAILGINCSCEQVEEYGTPYASFVLKGNVSDPDGHPIPGINVKMDYNETYTGTDGSYNLSRDGIPGESVTYDVIFSDVDSIENGLFSDDTIPVTFRRSDLSGGDGHWNEGSATKTLNVILKRKEE